MDASNTDEIQREYHRHRQSHKSHRHKKHKHSSRERKTKSDRNDSDFDDDKSFDQNEPRDTHRIRHPHKNRKRKKRRHSSSERKTKQDRDSSASNDEKSFYTEDITQHRFKGSQHIKNHGHSSRERKLKCDQIDSNSNNEKSLIRGDISELCLSYKTPSFHDYSEDRYAFKQEKNKFETALDFDFDFSNYKFSLNKIFFRDEEFLKRGSKDYDDFWVFLKKYQDFQRKRNDKKESEKRADNTGSELGLPTVYDKRYKINIGVISKNVEDFLKKGRLVGHASLIGQETGKVLGFDVRSKSCATCELHNAKNRIPSEHECHKNWIGSSKSMEPDLAVNLLHEMEDVGCAVDIIHADNDSTTMNRLKIDFKNLKKKDDQNHIKKGITKSLIAYSKKHKELSISDGVPYLTRCFMYAIIGNQNEPMKIEETLSRIVPHVFGDHSLCIGTDWCTYKDNPEIFRYKSLPGGKALTNQALRKDLEDIVSRYIQRSSSLIQLGSTQSNESFNQILSTKAPKSRNHCYCQVCPNPILSQLTSIPTCTWNLDLETDYDVEKELTIERVRQFKHILLHYLDFLQKQKFNKLKKLRADQENLPIFHYKSKIIDILKNNQVVVVAGDTGCGKSTQVPQYLLEAGYTSIACTQPRRIACISLSKRVGFETLNEYGSEVAYQVRFEKTKSRFTRILFLTEGLLLRQMSTDPHLSQYKVIVIDEVHERHIQTDFLLGLLKCLIMHRDDIKVVLMSATINLHLFSQYFDDAPVLQVPGRLFPIQMQYCPVRKEDIKAERLDPSPYLRIMQTIDHKYPETERGDLLIFLSGLSEIMTVVEAAKTYAQNTKRWIVLPLHGTLSVAEQDKVFDIAPDGVRKCIVSTNIAETSVTIDGVRFIVDSGKVKEMNFDPKYKMQKLQEFWISRASAEQRKGRAGRTGPGVCYRLYEESDFHAFQEYSTPEIQRVPLDSLVLQMIALGLPDARKFPFLEAPEPNSIENAIIFLKEQSALREDETLTPIGQMLSRLPVDVIIGKMLIMGSIFHMIDPVLSLAAAMSVQSPFTSRAHTDHDCMASRKPLESDHGDPFTLLNAFDEWIQVKAEGRGTKKWCRRRGLEEQRFYEMTKLKTQFKDLLKDHNLLDNDVDDAHKYLTSDERRKRHGERKRLGELKKVKDRESKRRKVLKLEDDDFQISDEEEDDKGDDIKDLEFRLSHDLDKLQNSSNRNRSFTLRDINLLKIILCSGLYPQVAIADHCNSYKLDSEQAFHTKSKPFLLLHPTSIFMTQPEVLQPPEMIDPPRCPTDLQGKLSQKHQLLAFLSLLETNKPYLMNTMRVPALQTVTMFSNNIDTDSTCMRLVCDGWLELRFCDEESATNVLSSIIQMRATWQNLLKLRLQDIFESFDDDKRINPRARKLEKILAKKLTEFLSSDVVYAVRRVLAAELNHLYKGPGKDPIQSDFPKPFMKSSTEIKEHPVKGGVQINDFLVYDCLLDEASATVWGEYTSHMQKHWTCPRCRQSLIVSVQERLLHESQCQEKNFEATKEEEAQEIEEEKFLQLNPLRKSYHCETCDKDFQFTTTEILKHRKSHTFSS